MASSILTPIPAQTGTEYRPISRLAVAGLLLAIPSVLLFLTNNLGWIFFLFSLPAMVLSAVALRGVRRSEGALAGETVALLGVVISVACGLGWVTSQIVTKLVTEMEARATVDDWLDKMRNDQSGAAFLLTQQPNKRKDIRFNPEDHLKLRQRFPDAQAASFYDSFIADPIYGQFLRYGKQATLEYRGLVEQQVKQGVQVYNFKYHLTTPETEGDLIISIHDEEVSTDQGVRREWLMGYDRNASILPLTRFGEEVQYAQEQATTLISRLVFAVANENKELIESLLVKAPAERGEFQVVYGYLRNKVEHVGMPMALQRPLRLRSVKKDGSTWTLMFDCTVQVNHERVVDFSITAVSEPSNEEKWVLRDVRFNNTRRIITPEDDPNAPKATLKRPPLPGLNPGSPPPTVKPQGY